MHTFQKKIAEIKPYKLNAKKHDQSQIQHVANSIKEFGFVQPIVIDENNEIVIGHCRYEASKLLGMKEVPVLKVGELTPQQVKALRLADNKTNESEWDFDLLNDELDDILDIDMEDFGFDLSADNANDFVETSEIARGSLEEDFIVPPFSVLDSRSGTWMNRKRNWISKGIDSGKGRDVVTYNY